MNMMDPSTQNGEHRLAEKKDERDEPVLQVPFSWLRPHPIFVILFVGPEKCPFGIQKDLLCHRSTYYRDHFAKAKQEEEVELTIDVPEVSPDTFGIAQQFFYTNRISGDGDSTPTYDQLVRLWKLGHKLGIAGLGDQVIHAMIKCRSKTGRIPSTPLLIEVWRDTPEGSDIRTLLLTWAAEYMHASDSRAEFAKSLPQEVLSELVVMMSSIPAPAPGAPPVQSAQIAAIRKNVHYLDEFSDEDGVNGTRKHRRVSGTTGPSSPQAGDTRTMVNKKNVRAAMPKPQKRRSSAAYLDPASITPAQKLDFCTDLLTRMLSGPGFWTRLVGPFRDAVDPATAPDYFEKVKRPMDLTKIKTKMDQGEYTDHEQFVADMRLIFENCFCYNQKGGPMYDAGEKLQKTFEDKFAGMNKWIAKMSGEEGD